MRIFKSLLVALIGLTALMYALQNIANVREMRRHMNAGPSATGVAAYPDALFSNSPAASWVGFALITLCQLVIAVIAFKGAWDLYAARAATDAEFKTAKSAAIWAGGLALFSWFALSLMIGAGLFRWGSDGGALALARSFQLGSTAALTILFVNGVRD